MSELHIKTIKPHISDELSIDGKVEITNDIAVLGGAHIDTDTVVVDSANHSVGIGTSSPDEKSKLHVVGNTKIDGNLTTTGKFLAPEGMGANGGYSFHTDTGLSTGVYSTSDGDLSLFSDSTKVLGITSEGTISNLPLIASQLVSNNAEGNAPLEVQSTTKVDNLNADKLDGADLSTDGTFASESDDLIPSQKATKTYFENNVKDSFYERFYENPFPSIFIENGLDPITVDSPQATKITCYDGAVNTLGYGHWETIWNYRYMTYINPLQKTNGEQTGARFIIELPIVDNEHLAFFLLSSQSGWGHYNIWYADPETDLPVKRCGWTQTHTESANYTTDNLLLGPDGRRDVETRFHHWLMVHLNKIDIASFKTSDNTIKLSICPGVNHQYAYAHISGFAMCRNPWGLAFKQALQIGSWCADGGAVCSNYGHHNESYMTSVGANVQVNGVRVPIIGDDDKDILFGQIFHKAAHYTGGTIWNLTGTDQRFFPKLFNIGRFARSFENGFRNTQAVKGFIIPKELVKEHMKTTEEGWRYLEFDMWNRSTNTEHHYGWYTEQIDDHEDLS